MTKLEGQNRDPTTYVRLARGRDEVQPENDSAILVGRFLRCQANLRKFIVGSSARSVRSTNASRAPRPCPSVSLQGQSLPEPGRRACPEPGRRACPEPWSKGLP